MRVAELSCGASCWQARAIRAPDGVVLIFGVTAATSTIPSIPTTNCSLLRNASFPWHALALTLTWGKSVHGPFQQRVLWRFHEGQASDPFCRMEAPSVAFRPDGSVLLVFNAFPCAPTPWRPATVDQLYLATAPHWSGPWQRRSDLGPIVRRPGYASHTEGAEGEQAGRQEATSSPVQLESSCCYLLDCLAACLCAMDWLMGLVLTSPVVVAACVSASSDPFLFRTRRGYHLLLHALGRRPASAPRHHRLQQQQRSSSSSSSSNTQGAGGLAWSRDGISWHWVNGSAGGPHGLAPYNSTSVTWQGGAVESLTRRQAPYLYVDAAGRMRLLLNGVDTAPGHGCHWRSSWTLAQPIAP
jgi:hypothetical protein